MGRKKYIDKVVVWLIPEREYPLYQLKATNPVPYSEYLMRLAGLKKVGEQRGYEITYMSITVEEMEVALALRGLTWDTQNIARCTAEIYEERKKNGEPPRND